MSVNGVTNAMQSYDNERAVKSKADKDNKTVVEKQEKNGKNTAAVYEKNTETTEPKKVYQRDNNTIDRLMADAEKRAQSLKDLVEKMLLKQGQTVNDATNIYTLLRDGKLNVDPQTRAQAQKDIADDGYWGVEQTSERLVSFAKALTGGDPSKAEEMIDAVMKGFKAATKAWGDKLPDISQRTLDATIKKLESWRDGNGMDNKAANTFKSQAVAGSIAK